MKRNVFAIARHNAQNTHIAVSRNGRAPFTMYRVEDLQPHESALSIVAVQHWLNDKGMTATAVELERKHNLETPNFPYAVRVRAIVGA